MEVVLHSQPLTQGENVDSTSIHAHPSNGESEEQEHDEEARMDSGKRERDKTCNNILVILSNSIIID